MARTFTLDPRYHASFQIGAMLMSILAFPAASEEELLKRAAQALCADFLRTEIAAFPARAAELQVAYPRYVEIDGSETLRRLRTLKRRLRDRMIASRMALGFLEEGISGGTAKLPTSIERHSLNDLSKLVLSQSGQNDPENVERRAWHDTQPVIHLAAAMQVLARALEPGTEPFGYPLGDGNLHREVIELAQFHERIVLSDHRFGGHADRLIHIRRRAEAA